MVMKRKDDGQREAQHEMYDLSDEEAKRLAVTHYGSAMLDAGIDAVNIVLLSEYLTGGMDGFREALASVTTPATYMTFSDDDDDCGMALTRELAAKLKPGAYIHPVSQDANDYEDMPKVLSPDGSWYSAVADEDEDVLSFLEVSWSLDELLNEDEFPDGWMLCATIGEKWLKDIPDSRDPDAPVTA